MKIQTVCRLCDHECPITVILDEERNPVKIMHDRIKDGFFCMGGLNILEMLYHPDRIKTPLIAEKGKDGEKYFRPASWEEALNLTAEKLKQSMQMYGQESVLAISGFNKPVSRAAYTRFCNVAGIINRVGSSVMCHMSQSISEKHSFGGPLKADINEKTRAIVMWGFNPSNTMRWETMKIWNAVKQGTKLIVIDPIPLPFSDETAKWLPIMPGTDQALAYGILHVMIEEVWYDKEFVSRYVDGMDELTEIVAKYDLKTVSELTGLKEEDIYCTAKTIALSGPTAIMRGNAIHHNKDGFQKSRAIDAIIALSGNIDVEGAMIYAPKRSEHNRFFSQDLAGSEYYQREWDQKRIGAGKYSIKECGMVSGQDAVRAIQEGMLKSGLIFGSDPVLQWADSGAVARALESLDFLVAVNFFLTPSTQLADVVLPAATFLEYESIAIDGDENLLYSPCLYDKYDVLPDVEIFRRLAEAMGYGQQFWSNMEEFWNKIAEPYGSSIEEIRQRRYVETDVRKNVNSVCDCRKKGFFTNDGKTHLKGTDGSPDRLKDYSPLQSVSEEYPIRCTTFKPGPFFGSAGQKIAKQQNIQPEPRAYMSRETAEKYGLNDDSLVRIVSETGSCIQKLKVVKKMASETIALSNARWNTFERDTKLQIEWSANNLTSRLVDTGTDIPAFSCRGIGCRVENV